ncbi:MAG: aldolase/citrate lyase family protein [Alphaproteobacteria bacterium]
MMKTILITGNPDIAADAEAAGVSRIMVDLETMGKKERQASRTTFISSHNKEDVARVRSVLKNAELIVRVNPWHYHSEEEILYAVGEGADFIMLPMIQDIQHVRKAVGALSAHIKLLPLIETSYSMECIADIAAMKEIPELYIGLNDLHLSLGLEFLFEPLAMGLLDAMAENIRKHGKPFGFGGIAKMGSGELPAERILAEHERLGSTRVILSSRFCKDISIESQEGRTSRIRDALVVMQQEYLRLQTRDDTVRQQDFEHTASIIMRIGNELKLKRQAI